MSNPLLRGLFSCFAALLALPAISLAQAVYGNIVGAILDPSGAAVQGAKVTITDTVRSVTFSATTNESGNFVQRYLIASTYRVRIEAQGFQTYVQENVVVTVDADTRVQAQLKVGDVAQIMEVAAEVPLLKTERGEVSQSYNERTVSELPIFNRKFTSFELLTPGVQAVAGQTARSEDPQGSYRKYVNGQSFAGTTHLLDGTDNHDAMLGLIVINPTLESVTDAKVSTQNYDAEFGASAGVVSSQIWELPFGKGKQFLNNLGRAAGGISPFSRNSSSASAWTYSSAWKPITSPTR
jgi:hypothetical protein